VLLFDVRLFFLSSICSLPVEGKPCKNPKRGRSVLAFF
jgi:hypothetical protein